MENLLDLLISEKRLFSHPKNRWSWNVQERNFFCFEHHDTKKSLKLISLNVMGFGAFFPRASFSADCEIIFCLGIGCRNFHFATAFRSASNSLPESTSNVIIIADISKAFLIFLSASPSPSSLFIIWCFWHSHNSDSSSIKIWWYS